MANIQLFNVFKYAKNYVAPLLRHSKFLAYLQALLSPVQTKRDLLTDEIYPDLERRTRYNAQVARFEKILNTIFGVTSIYIDEAFVNVRVYTYNDTELQPLYLYSEAEYTADPTLDRVYLYNTLEFLPSADFTVHVPQNLYDTQLPRLNSEIKKRKLVGVTYNIVPF